MHKTNENEPTAEAVSQLSDIGKQLRRAREADSLSIQSVATSLHLAPRVIIALEENDFSQFQPVFVKGYLRNYGRLLNLPVEPLLESYNRTLPPDQDYATTAHPLSHHPSKTPWGLYLILALGVLALVTWVAINNIFSGGTPGIPAEEASASLPPLPAQSANETENTPIAPDNDADHRPVGLPVDKPDTANSVAVGGNDLVGPPKPESMSLQDNPQSNANPQPLATTMPESLGPDKLALNLSSTAWVGIRDHIGRRLVYKKVPAGTALNLSGQAPFYVVLGNAAATKIEFNGTPFTPPKTKAGAIARFTLGKANTPHPGQ